MCLVKDEPHGLNSDVDFDFVMVDTQIIDRDMVTKMQNLQSKSKVRSCVTTLIQFIYLVRSIDLAKDMRDFGITVRLLCIPADLSATPS